MIFKKKFKAMFKNKKYIHWPKIEKKEIKN